MNYYGKIKTFYENNLSEYIGLNHIGRMLFYLSIILLIVFYFRRLLNIVRGGNNKVLPAQSKNNTEYELNKLEEIPQNEEIEYETNEPIIEEIYEYIEEDEE